RPYGTRSSSTTAWRRPTCSLTSRGPLGRWVIQELAFAKKPTVYCGKASVSWEELNCASVALARLGEDGHFLSQYLSREGRYFRFASGGLRPTGALDRIRQTMRPEGETGDPVSNFISVAEASEFDCKEDKDRIFALLGIFNHNRQHPFTIDYNLPTPEIYREFALFCM